MAKKKKARYEQPEVSGKVEITKGVKCTRQWNAGGAWP